jgi:hypothetical protein
VEQSAREYSLVLLSSDDDAVTHSSGGSRALFSAAAADVEEGFELAQTDNPNSTLLQVSINCQAGQAQA